MCSSPSSTHESSPLPFLSHMKLMISYTLHNVGAHGSLLFLFHTCLYNTSHLSCCPRTFLSPQIRSKTSHPSHPFVYKRRDSLLLPTHTSPFIHKWMARMACFRSDLRAKKGSWAVKTSVMCYTSMCEKGKEDNHVHSHCEVCMKS
jgi:hypothetical protein